MKKNEPETVLGSPADAKEGMLFEPFFRSRQEAVQIQRFQTVAERRKFAVAYRLEGCFRCGTRERPHQALCFCEPCYSRFRRLQNKALRLIARGEAE